MQEGFKRIMVLIDFSPVSLHAAEEASAIAAKFKSELHLVYVSTTSLSLMSMLFPKLHSFHTAERDKTKLRSYMYKMEKLKIDLENQFDIKIICSETKGGLKETISNYLYQNNINLLVIGSRMKHGLKEFASASMIEKIIDFVNCEVLCVYEESDCKRLKNIVIPVGYFVPKRKIKLAYELSRKFAANIHLIALNENQNSTTKYLLAAYQYLKDITNIPVECRTVAGTNIAAAAVRYAKSIDADLILVNPGAESHFPGNILRKWGRDIVNYSTVPVLSVHSIMSKVRPALRSV